eukprot:458886-Pyramimonas_sp.AAC.1
MLLTAAHALWEAGQVVWPSLSPIASSALTCAVQSTYVGSPYAFSVVTFAAGIVVGAAGHAVYCRRHDGSSSEVSSPRPRDH